MTQACTQIVVGRRYLGRDSQPGPIAPARFLITTAARQQVRQHEMRIGIVVHDRGGPGQAFYGLVQASLRNEQIAEVSMRVGKLGVDSDGIAIGRFGFFEPALYSENVTDIRIRGGGRRIEPRRFT